MNHYVSSGILVLTLGLFILNGGMLAYRLIRFPGDVKLDFNHPVKMNFFGAISISLLLLATAFLGVNHLVSFILWILGASLQLALTLAILSKLIWQASFKIEHFNPIWFIPIVGNIVVPIAESSHVIADVNWFFFSIGIIFIIIYMTFFFNRVFFYQQIPVKLLPTFFILMAPPALGFVSYVNLRGDLNAFAYILYGSGFFIGLLLMTQVKRFISVQFSLASWAFLFPSAAITTATIQLYNYSDHHFYKGLLIIQIAGLVLLTIYLAWRTIQLAINRSLCVKDS